jgi:hypothetical protein
MFFCVEITYPEMIIISFLIKVIIVKNGFGIYWETSPGDIPQ